jgi:hypothetical protein
LSERGRGGGTQGKKNRKEKDLITYVDVDKPSTKTHGQRRGRVNMISR